MTEMIYYRNGIPISFVFVSIAKRLYILYYLIMINSKKLIISTVILLVLFFTGFFIYKDFFGGRIVDKKKMLEEKNKDKTNQTLLNLPVDLPVEQEGKTNKEQIRKSAMIKEKIPDLTKLVVVKTNLPEDVKKETIEKINALSNSLKKDYNSLEQWLELGLLRKLIGDYDGARDVWKFATIIRPNNAVAFHNLGFLYWQNFKDYKKAEENYLKAIENNPQDIGAYIDLSNVYYFSLKDTTRAKDILNTGLKNNPGNEELKRAMRDMNL